MGDTFVSLERGRQIPEETSQTDAPLAVSFWSWLTAVGASSLLPSLAPCSMMCATGTPVELVPVIPMVDAGLSCPAMGCHPDRGL